MSSHSEALASFVQNAPPGELSNVIKDIKEIVGIDTVKSLDTALKKYNEEQLTTVKLPGSSQNVLISEHNTLEDGRYYDVDSAVSFQFDHATQKATGSQSYSLESSDAEKIKSIQKSLRQHANEHYPSSTVGVFPSKSIPKAIAILTVSNKYSPNNYWNGRWRSSYTYNPSAGDLTGTIKVDVHYYEDGNVRLATTKNVSTSVGSSASGQEIVKSIAEMERKYQEELNRGFAGLSEGAFKSLRRQLPVTRQKMEWEKVASYRVGQDLGGSKR